MLIHYTKMNVEDNLFGITDRTHSKFKKSKVYGWL